MTSALRGRRVVVTRARAQAGTLAGKLAALGAHPIVLPTIQIAPLDDPSQLDQAIHALATYQWVIFTSVNGVSAFWQRLDALGQGARHFGDVAVAAIGPVTAQALTARGITPRLVPSEYIAEAIAAEIGDVRGQRILLPHAAMAREALAVELCRRGATVDEVASYRTVMAAPDPRALEALRQGVDAILFTSSSTARNFVELAGCDTGQAVVACIGPVTAQTSRELGLQVGVIAGEYTVDGLIRALELYFEENPQSQEKQV